MTIRWDVNQEDIAMALKEAGSDKQYIDRQDFATVLKQLESTSALGLNHSYVDDQDISEFINQVQGGLGGSIPLPTLDLDLTNPATASLLTCTRAGLAWSDNNAGVWSQFAANTPRITDKGILAEEARTNSIRNNSMQGAVAGSPGTLPTNWSVGGATGLTRTIVGMGTENGIDFIDVRFQGTVSSGTSMTMLMDGTTTIAASNGQTWTTSVFAALKAGSLINIAAIAFKAAIYAAGPAYLADIANVSLTNINNTLKRYAGTGTIAAPTVATIAPYLQIAYNPGAVIDITLRIGWPQLEQGGFVTSPIRTTTAAVVRAADSIVVNNPGIVNTAAFSMFWDYVSICAAASRSITGVLGGWARTLAFTDTAYGSLPANGTVTPNIVVGGTGQFSNGITGHTGIAPVKFAYAAQLNDARAAVNSVLGTPDAIVPIASAGAVASLKLGGSPWVAAASAAANAYIRRFSLWNQRLTDNELRVLTALTAP